MTDSTTASISALLVSSTMALCAASALFSPPTSAADDAGLLTARPTGYKPRPGDAKLGEKLFNDPKLSTNGMTCATCHANHAPYSDSFAKPYPHTVAMARDQLGRKQAYLDEMIQACMEIPMATKPLPWDSMELAALVAFVEQEQRTFKPAKH